MINKQNKSFKFIDLFAGIGGFHQAMVKHGGECVMASEIDENAIEVYKHNFPNTNIRGDINTIDPKLIPKFDVLCAGFPCQPFSKAGKRLGFEDEGRGGLFYKILDILDTHDEVKYFILENVRNLADNSNNWSKIISELGKRNFTFSKEPLILSPTNFDIPQERERVYILGVSKKHINCDKELYINELGLPMKKRNPRIELDATKILQLGEHPELQLSDEKQYIIEAWEELYKDILNGPPGHTVWMHYFRPQCKTDRGFKISVKWNQQPHWKQLIINSNREFYLNNKDYIDEWAEKHNMWNRKRQYQKFEWNAGYDIESIKSGILQFRQSGLRIKRKNYFPTLVAKGDVPIIYDEKLNAYRYLSISELAKLQNFNSAYVFKGNYTQSYKQLGNSVNVSVIEKVAGALFSWGSN